MILTDAGEQIGELAHFLERHGPVLPSSFPDQKQGVNERNSRLESRNGIGQVGPPRTVQAALRSSRLIQFHVLEETRLPDVLAGNDLE